MEDVTINTDSPGITADILLASMDEAERHNAVIFGFGEDVEAYRRWRDEREKGQNR